MKRCPITYEIIPATQWYSERGLKLLSPKLKNLIPLPLSAEEQRIEAVNRVGKMSIQGVQTKLSARLKITGECFEIVDRRGNYILKTQSNHYPELPENEALTMSLAAMIGIEVPVHGLVYASDSTLTYFIKRFDRAGHQDTIALEDFTQLSDLSRETKYDSSMEKVSGVIEKFCTYPKIEMLKLFKLTLFNFITGNEDMHLKNFSLITRGNHVSLSPAYDLLNTTIATPNTQEEIALPIAGKKNNLKRNSLIDYFGIERLKLNENVISDTLQEIKSAIPAWQQLIEVSFLSEGMKEKYAELLENRLKRLEL